MKGTFVERDRKKKEKKVKGADAGTSKKGLPGAVPIVALPGSVPVSRSFGVLSWLSLNRLDG